MNKPVTSFGSAASALLAATVLATGPVTAGIRSNYVGAGQTLADLGKPRHQVVSDCRGFGCYGYPDTGIENWTLLVPLRQHLAGPAAARPTLSTATGKQP